MDKNKNRTDLLAAGRKKLQQFRKKKETKGKSSHKTSQSEQGDQEGDVDPPSSPKAATAAEGETTLSRGNSVEIRDTLEPDSAGSSVGIDAVSIASDPSVPAEFVPVQQEEVVIEPVDDAREENTVNVEHDEAHVSTVGPSEETVVIEEQIQSDSRDKEEGIPGLQEVSNDNSTSNENENQEADSSGSNQCDGRDKEIYGSLQDGEHLGDGYIRLENEGDQESAVSEPRGNCEDNARESHGLDRTKSVTQEDNLSPNDKIEETPTEPAIFVSAEPEEIAYTDSVKGGEGANYRIERTNDIDGVSSYADENDNAGLPVSASTISREEKMPSMVPEEGTEETSDRIAETNEQTRGPSNGSALAGTDNEIEGTPDIDGEEKLEFQPEGVEEESSHEKETEIMPLSNDLASESKAGFQEDVEQDSSVNELYKQQISPELAGLVSVRQESPLEQNMIFYGGQGVSCCTDTGSIDLNQLAKVIQGLNEEEVGHLLKMRLLTCKTELENIDVPEEELGNVVESLKQQLYFASVAKDFFQLQLSEQTVLQKDFDHQDIQMRNEISKLNFILKETQDCNASLNQELAQCRSDLQAMAAGREELETQFIDAREELALCKSDLHAMTAEREGHETQFTSAREELAQYKFDLQAMAAGREKLETQLTGATKELAQCRSDLQIVTAGREELETKLTGATNELAQCWSNIQTMAAGREELETQLASAREEIVDITARSFELQTQMERSHEEIATRLAELAAFRVSMEALETENFKLHENVTEVVRERKKFEEENKHIVHENERLAAQLLEHQDHVSREHDMRVKLEDDLKEAMLRLEQLTQENIFLSSSLDVHQAKMKEYESQQSLLHAQAADSRYQLEGPNTPPVYANPTDGEYSRQSPQLAVGKVSSGVSEPVVLGLTNESSLQPHEGKNLVDSIGFSDFKAYIEEAEETIQKLEKAMEVMHSHSVSLSRSGGKVAGAGVSKLIQAFESKVQHDDNGPGELPLDEGEKTIGDHFTLSKETTSSLRDTLKKLDLSALKVNEELEEEKRSRKLASAALSELQILYEASKQESNNLEARISELVKTLSDSQSRADDMHLQLHTLQQKSDEMEGLFFDQLRDLQKGADDKLSVFEQEWNFTVAEVSEIAENLNASIGRLWTTTYSTVQSDDLSIGHRVAASANAATKVIQDMHEKLGAAYTSLTKTNNSYESLAENFSDLQIRNGLAVEILSMICAELKKFIVCYCEDVQGSGIDLKDEDSFDHLQPSNYIYLLSRLSELLGERSLLKSAKVMLEAELTSSKQEVAELKNKSIDYKSIFKLLEDVKSVVKLDDMENDSDDLSVSHMESLVALLVQKYREASEQVSRCKEELELKVMAYSELQAKVHELSSLSSHHEAENQILKKHLREVDGTVEALRSDLQLKGAELEQSEQKVSSVREKLSIAVAKGKGLIVQRDNLKQSLSDISSELERCTQELQLKDTRLREVETKLKTYSEAGERIEALESELSYIRNSATALRESFLLKDSVLQRIEEVLEELELPEHFHSRDIIEKIEWLARSVSGNSLPVTSWDQESSVVEGSCSDGGFVVMEGWKDDTHPISNPGLEDLKRKNEELQSKFYGLAEQNEMLEQSLMERNRLVQRWEEALDRMDVPLQLRSVDTEERIEWLGNALSEAHHGIAFLQKQVESFKDHCGSLTADLEQSQRKVSDLELALEGVTREKELLSENLLCHQQTALEKVTQFEHEKCNLQSEVASLQEKLVQKLENDDYHHHVEDEIKRLQVLVSDALQEQSADDRSCDGKGTECLEGLLRKLIARYMALSSEKSVHNDELKEHSAGDSDMARHELRKEVLWESDQQERVIPPEEFDEVLRKLSYEKEEREKILQKHQSLVADFEALGKQKDELQEKLNQEEMKLVSTRDKLNVAVRKGKALVQHRDSLKQSTEEMKTHMDHLKNELDQRERAVVQCQQKIRELSTYTEKAENLEDECLLLKSRLTETEHRLQESGDILSSLKNTLNAIDIGNVTGLSTSDPMKKLEMIGKLWHELQAALTSSEHESKKSKRATELLLAELNEVHERADGLQDELSKVETALVEISKERDLAEAARSEALSRLENIITVHSEERKKELAEVVKLKALVGQLMKGCYGFSNHLADVFTMESELLSNMEYGMESLLKLMDGTNVASQPLLVAPGGVFSHNFANEVNFHATDTSLETKIVDSFADYSIIDVIGIIGQTLQECTREVDTSREKCYKYTVSSEHQAKRISKAMESVHKEIASQKKSLESKTSDYRRLEFVEKEKDTEILKMRRMIALLYKACTSSILEIKTQRAQIVPDGGQLHGKKEMDLELPRFVDGQEHVDGHTSFTEESINSIADNLLLVVKDSASTQADTIKSSEKELRATISNLQKELQENEIQKDRIYTELVSQIKKAEADAKRYLVDLQSANAQVDTLEKHIEGLEKDRTALELRIKELHDGETSNMQLQERIKSLTDSLDSKGQEIEDLMQALDEEESQMEDLRSKNQELEKTLEQKDLALENLEASRGKAMAKLSTTVSKFDELHQMSEALLSEVENLQSQLQGRDSEISFLRQEVTRCTNDVLAAAQDSNRRNLTEIDQLLTWLDMIISRFGGYDHDAQLEDKGSSRMAACKATLEKRITSLLSELEALRVMSRNKDALLEVEKSRSEELSRKSDSLERFLHEKELKLASLQGSRDLGETASIASSEITEVEPTINKRAVAGASVAPHVRSMRKANGDQVAISIDVDAGGTTVDEEDDKVHGFKSLTTSRVVPRFTRPVSDMIDGLWVSCDRALMRQPALRLGIILYWFMLHTLVGMFMI